MSQTIRLIKPYSLHNKGDVVSVDAGIAAELIRTGRAEVIAPDPPKIVETEKEVKQWRPSKITKKRHSRN